MDVPILRPPSEGRPDQPGGRNIILRTISTIVFLCGFVCTAQPPSINVTGVVSISRNSQAGTAKPDNSNAVVWLKPEGTLAEHRNGTPATRPKFEIRQQHKRFDPRVLPIPVGSSVAFPNLDPFFHNVFSMFDGKRFDLGLYEAGVSHSVTFDRIGICYIFCNIHPEMSAAVVVLDTPYYAVSNRAGHFSIPNVPAGRYLVFVWHERGKLESSSALSREIVISAETPSLPTIRLTDSGDLLTPHKNKYGHDYDPPTTLYK